MTHVYRSRIHTSVLYLKKWLEPLTMTRWPVKNRFDSSKTVIFDHWILQWVVTYGHPMADPTKWRDQMNLTKASTNYYHVKGFQFTWRFKFWADNETHEVHVSLIYKGRPFHPFLKHFDDCTRLWTIMFVHLCA